MTLQPPLPLDRLYAHRRLLCGLAIALLAALPGLALGQDASETIDAACRFASNINKVLNAVSIVVVTIAVVFAGYQIAYAHKRISDVAPILVGAILIGAAGQIAKMFLAGSTSASGAAACTVAFIADLVNGYA